MKATSDATAVNKTHHRRHHQHLGETNKQQNSCRTLGLALITFPSLAIAAPSVSTGRGGPLCGKVICKKTNRWMNDVCAIENRTMKTRPGNTIPLPKGTNEERDDHQAEDTKSLPSNTSRHPQPATPNSTSEHKGEGKIDTTHHIVRLRSAKQTWSKEAETGRDHSFRGECFWWRLMTYMTRKPPLTFSSPVSLTRSCSQLKASSAVGLRRQGRQAKKGTRKVL